MNKFIIENEYNNKNNSINMVFNTKIMFNVK